MAVPVAIASGRNPLLSGENKLATTPIIPPYSFNKALVFDGVNDYLNVPNIAAYNNKNTFSISLWLKPALRTSGFLTDTTGGTSLFNTAGFTRANSFFLDMWGTGLQTAEINAGFYGADPIASNYSVVFTAPTAITAGEWQHVVFTKTSSTATNWLVYVNGVLIATTVVAEGTSVPTLNVVPRAFSIGNDQNVSFPAREYYKGAMDDVMLYDRVLTPAEVMRLYGNGFGTAPRSNMVPALRLWLRMDEAAGELQRAFDSSPYHNPAEMTNFTGTNYVIH